MRYYKLTLAVLVLSAFGWANPITSVFGTGQNAAHGLLAGGQIDTHYAIIASALGTPPALVFDGTPSILTPPYPIGVWDANGPSSMWIAPTANTNAPAGPYDYQTTFDLTGFDVSTASLSGAWATDDGGSAFLNGHFIGSIPFAHLSAFTVSNPAFFLPGINTLEFDMSNSGGPTGLRVNLTGSAEVAVPEPATLFLLGSGLLSVGRMLRRKAA